LICPKCRNEKLDQDVCPQCGLAEREALLQAAQLSRQKGNISSAIDFFDRYLHLEPDNIEVKRQKIACLYLETVKSMEPSRFDQVNRMLALGLERDWNWETGHQYRINLFSSFGRLNELEEEYLRIRASDETKQAVCVKVLNIIQLTKKFKEETPLSADSAPNARLSWLRKAWPLLLLPIVLWGMFKLSDTSASKDPEYFSWMPFVWIILGILVILLLLVAMKLNRYNSKKNEAGKN
jgi:hypothetical protein